MGDLPAGRHSTMELRVGDMPTYSNSSVELSVGEASSLDLEESEDVDACSDYPQDSSYSDPLSDQVVTGKFDDDIWIWIIEYIAKFKKELWMLFDVFEMGPQLPDDLGGRTNEMVAFRCLAFLFGPGDGQNNVPSDTEPKVEFDLSESCEYVLQCILDEIPLSDLKPGAPELSKWNLLSFIKHKRLCLPKCAFELLREGSHQESTGLFPGKEQEAMKIDGHTNDQVTPGLGGQNIVETMEKEGEPFPDGPANEDELLGDENETSPCETNRCDVMMPDSLEENDDGNQDTSMVDENLCTKANNVERDAPDASELLEDDNEYATEAEEGFNLSNDNQEGSTEMSRSSGQDHDACMALVELQGIGDANDRNGQMGLPDNANVLSPETAIDFSIAGQKPPGKYPSGEAEEREGPEKEKGQKQMDCFDGVIAIDNMNPNHSEKIDGARIEGYPSSPSANRYSCKQCKKAGQLLLCSSEECPVMIHEKCLHSPPAYDDMGNFYCPPCAYVRASSEYLESEAQVAEAKKKLVTFLDVLNSKLKQKIATDRYRNQG